MEVLRTVPEVRRFVHAARTAGRSVGLVPTMGAFHEGHLTLMRRAHSECNQIVVSLFVNPTQFGPHEDLARYPRNLERDTQLAEQIPVQAMFVPDVETMYPPGSQTIVEVPEIASRWEGEIRPGHFRGVATVCAKLFSIVQPDRAYFGRKDYQQLKLIHRMVMDLHLPLEIVPVPTVRDPDGLALSSRNAYLDRDQRRAALALSRALRAAHERYTSGDRSGAALEQTMREVVAAEPLVQLQYAAVVDAESLEPLQELDRPAVALIAGKVGNTRLIDNQPVGDHAEKSA